MENIKRETLVSQLELLRVLQDNIHTILIGILTTII